MSRFLLCVLQATIALLSFGVIVLPQKLLATDLRYSIAVDVVDTVDSTNNDQPSLLSISGIVSGVMQGHNKFSSYDAGNHILGNGMVSFTIQPWSNTEINVSPMWMFGDMAAAGFGMAGNANALFSFSSELPFLGTAYIRHKFDFARTQGDNEPNNAIVTVGKIVVPSMMEANTYANDPTSQFLNISSLGFGAWELAQEARGTSLGASIQFNRSDWSLTVVAAMLPDVAGGNGFWLNVDECHGIAAQIAFNTSSSGRVRFLGFYNRANAINFEQGAQILAAGAEAGIATEDIDVRSAQYLQSKIGFGLEYEQHITDGVGTFFRASWNDGKSESYTFTQINASLNAGADLSGTLWGQEQHHAGVNVVYNMLSDQQRKFIEAGGSGFMVGDGSLNYQPEIVTEGYYRVSLLEYVGVTLNYQFILNPGYNADVDALHFLGTRFTVSL